MRLLSSVFSYPVFVIISHSIPFLKVVVSLPFNTYLSGKGQDPGSCSIFAGMVTEVLPLSDPEAQVMRL